MLPKVISRRRILLALSLALGFSGLISCVENAPEISQEELYLRGFIKQFGVPADKHSWSMSSQVEAEINLSGRPGGVATFYTDAPMAPGSQILARTNMSGGVGNVCFDVEPGTERVYVKITDDDGTTVWSGLAYNENGKIRISDTRSRAGECQVTAEALDYSVMRVTDNNLAKMKPYVGQNKTWEALLTELGNQEVDPVDSKVEMPIPNLYALNNFDFSQKTPEFTNLDIIPIVYSYINVDGEEERGIFGNQSDMNIYGGEDNITRYYFKDRILDPDVTMTVRSDGPVTLDMMWRTTEGEMYWGYYYYDPEDEAELYADPKKFFDEVPKYVVFRRNSIDPEHSISGNNGLMEYRYCANWSQHPDVYNPNQQHEGDHVIKDEWENLVSSHAKTISTNIKYFRPSIIRSTSIKLVYFGEDGKGDSSYDFPAGTRIGFFYGSMDNKEKFYLGNAKLNYYLFHYHIHTMSEYTPDEDPSNHSIFAAKYRYNGSNYVGFEEGGGDNDLNDLVFRIHNTWPPEVDLTPKDIPLAQPKEWIVACEDYGSFDDYDFNDIILKLSHVGGTNELAIKPLACGGTLTSFVYFGGTADSQLIGEIHDMLNMPRGVVAGVGGGSPDIDFSNVATYTYEVDPESSITDIKDRLYFHTEHPDGRDEGTWIGTETSGDKTLRAPQMLLLPTGWCWPVESRHIIDAYSRFKNWSGNPGENADWVNHIENPDYVYKRID